MPALVKYERKPLTMAQFCAVRDYIARRRLRELQENSGTNGAISLAGGDEKQDNAEPEIVTCVRAGPVTPPAPTAKEIREEKRNALRDLSEELTELENTLEELKQKKHGLFEELKSLLSSEKENKKLAEEKERLIHGYPSPFMAQSTGPAGSLMTVSPPYRLPLGMVGIKRPKSPSPPLVQLYSPGRTNLQPSYDMPQSSPGLTLPHHPVPAHNTFGEVQRHPFQPMSSNVSAHPDNILPGYQFQQNCSPRDPRHQVHGPQVNPHAPTSPQAPVSHYTQERQFIEQRHPHDRHVPSFGHPQGPALAISDNAGHGLGIQNHPRQTLTNQSPFLQQNTLAGQQQVQANITDGLRGFNNSVLHRPQGQMKRGGHLPNRSSRYY